VQFGNGEVEYEAGIWTDSPDDTFDLCTTAPRKPRSCSAWTFTAPDADQYHWRDGTVRCEATDVGTYSFSWRIRGVPIGTILPSYHARKATTVAFPCEGFLGMDTDPLGPESATLPTNGKFVNEYPLPSAAWLEGLSIYLFPTGTPGIETLQGVVYSDANGSPDRLVARTHTLTYKSSYVASDNWPTLFFKPYVQLPAGKYWFGILTGGTPDVAGVRYENVANSLASNKNDFSAGASDPFGPFATSPERVSLQVEYTYRHPTTSSCGTYLPSSDPCPDAR
jgi:hypothetical protein